MFRAKAKLKVFFAQCAVLVIFFGSLELFCYALDSIFHPRVFEKQNVNLFDDSVEYTHISKFYRDNFCDVVHVKNSGHQIMAQCLSEYLTQNINFNTPKQIYAVGGSTTEGRDCNTTIRWTDLIEKEIPNLKVLNLGESGSDTGNDLENLKQQLMKGPAPDYVLWGGWINDIFGKESKSDFYAVKKFLFRLYATLYKHFRSARLISNVGNSLLFDEFSIIDAANSLSTNSERAVRFVNERQRANFASKEFFQSSLDFYRDNTAELLQLSKKYNFKVIVQGFPFVPDMLIERQPRLNLLFESWITFIKRQQQESATANQFMYVDSQLCFEHNRQIQEKNK